MRIYQPVLAVLCVSIALGGSISGHVCDTSGNPLVGATVMVVGTAFGAMTTADGGYLIENLEPGIYTLMARMVGMGERTVSIQVFDNQVTEYDFAGPAVFQDHTRCRMINPDPMSGRILVHRDDLTVTDLPLEHTSASIAVTGNVQQAVVRQVYQNPFDVPIEVTYVFPLPVDGAVNRMSVYIGDLLIEGHVYERETADEIYEEAVEEGRTAALLVQERNNIFTQRLGNILPGDSITVEICYVAPVSIYENEFELVFPTVVAPKYIPGEPVRPGERGWSDPTDQVPDADRINPSVYPEGMRSGYDIDISVTIDAGIPVRDLASVNHEIVMNGDNNVVTVHLAAEEVIPNRDFILRYNIDSEDWEAGLLATNGDAGGHFMLVLKPDAELVEENPAPREYVFVVDCSGSMSGQPIAVAKETMRHFMRSMSSEDTFQIIKFSNTASSFAEAPIPATRRNVNLGLAYVEMMSGVGGTEMLNGVRAALGYPEDTRRNRYVIFLTDGQIGNDARVIAEVRNTRDAATLLWSVGIGSSPNRTLLDGLAEEGGGRSFYVSLQEDPGVVAARVHEQVNGNFISNVSIDWGDLNVADVFPEEMPFLFPGEPLFIVGRYQGGGSARIKISGDIGDDSWSERFRVVLPFHEEGNSGIASVWARQKIHQLQRYMLGENDQEIKNDLIGMITRTALTYQLVSNYTSFVAVSEEVRTDYQGNLINVEVPVNMPEGMSYQGTFGSSSGGLAPQAVGATVITVSDQRGMILRGVTSSVSVVARDPSPQGTTAAPVRESVSVETFVTRNRDMSETTESGAVVSILSVAFSSQTLDDSQEDNLVSQVLRVAADVYAEQSVVDDGMIIVRLVFPTGSGDFEVEIVQNFTDSDDFAEAFAEGIRELSLSSNAARALTVEISIEFTSS